MVEGMVEGIINKLVFMNDFTGLESFKNKNVQLYFLILKYFYRKFILFFLYIFHIFLATLKNNFRLYGFTSIKKTSNNYSP